jgi:hypothetical protein
MGGVGFQAGIFLLELGADFGPEISRRDELIVGRLPEPVQAETASHSSTNDGTCEYL